MPAGVQSEAQLPFAGLHQLLRPVRERAAGLPLVQRGRARGGVRADARGVRDRRAPGGGGGRDRLTAVPDRQAARLGRVLAYQALTGACVIAIAAAIVLAIYVMADK